MTLFNDPKINSRIIRNAIANPEGSTGLADSVGHFQVCNKALLDPWGIGFEHGFKSTNVKISWGIALAAEVRSDGELLKLYRQYILNHAMAPTNSAYELAGLVKDVSIESCELITLRNESKLCIKGIKQRLGTFTGSNLLHAVEALLANYDGTKEEHKRAFADLRVKAEAAKETRDGELETLKNSHMRWEVECKDVTEQRNKLSAQVKDLKAELKRLKGMHRVAQENADRRWGLLQAEKSKSQELEAEVKGLKAELKERKGMHCVAQEDADRRLDVIECERAHIKELEAEVKGLKAELKERKRVIEAQDGELETVYRERNEALETVRELDLKRGEVAKQRDRANEELGVCRGIMKALHQKIVGGMGRVIPRSPEEMSRSIMKVHMGCVDSESMSVNRGKRIEVLQKELNGCTDEFEALMLAEQDHSLGIWRTALNEGLYGDESFSNDGHKMMAQRVVTWVKEMREDFERLDSLRKAVEAVPMTKIEAENVKLKSIIVELLS